MSRTEAVCGPHGSKAAPDIIACLSGGPQFGLSAAEGRVFSMHDVQQAVWILI